jgi:phage gp46-like protein
MTDIKLAFNGTEIDLVLEDEDLARDDGLETAILISLFTDRRANLDELEEADADPRGWWADGLSTVDGDETGSKLWLLERAKATTETLERAREFAEESLQWLVDDGVAEAFTVTTEYQPDGSSGKRLAIEVLVERPHGETGKYKFLWASLSGA